MAGTRWNGSSWASISTKKRWNGSTWVDLTIAKRWNGSTWVDLFAATPLALGNTTADFTDTLSCDNPTGSCPLSDAQSDVVVYNISGGTSPYTVTAVVSDGPALTIAVDNVAKTITASTTVGRNDFKTGEIKVTVTDSAGAPAVVDFFLPFSFTYVYTQESQPPPFDPDPPPIEGQEQF